MNDKDFEKTVGIANAEIVATFLTIIYAIRKQKTFDDKAFQAEIKGKMNAPRATAFMKELLARSIK